MIQMSLFSQATSKTTSLTDKDTVMVSVKYRYIVATRMLKKDWLGEKKLNNQQLYTIQTQDRLIAGLLKDNSYLKQNDSINKVVIKNDSILSVNANNQIVDLHQQVRKHKAGKIIAAIAVPVVAVLAFLLGHSIH